MLSVKEITYRIDKNILSGIYNRVTIINNISFSLNKGEILGISGESGCGKTTLAKLLAGIIIPTSGSITLDKEISDKKKVIQMLFQNSVELLNPFRTVDAILSDTLALQFSEKKTIEIEKERLLSILNIESHLLNRKGGQLSGGEQQRVAIARILAVQPEIIILDEPFSAQDIESQLNVIKLLKNINSQFKVTLICFTHDVLLLPGFANEMIILNKGKILEKGKTENLFKKPLHPYTKYLIESAEYKSENSNAVLKSEVSEAADCFFYKNCINRQDNCITEVKLQKEELSEVFCNYPLR